jgi:branched-chain amino acid aminotransferase
VGEGTIGPITAKLQRLYFDVVRGKVATYRPWLTQVY